MEQAQPTTCQNTGCKRANQQLGGKTSASQKKKFRLTNWNGRLVNILNGNRLRLIQQFLKMHQAPSTAPTLCPACHKQFNTYCFNASKTTTTSSTTAQAKAGDPKTETETAAEVEAEVDAEVEAAHRQFLQDKKPLFDPKYGTGAEDDVNHKQDDRSNPTSPGTAWQNAFFSFSMVFFLVTVSSFLTFCCSSPAFHLSLFVFFFSCLSTHNALSTTLLANTASMDPHHCHRPNI